MGESCLLKVSLLLLAGTVVKLDGIRERATARM